MSSMKTLTFISLFAGIGGLDLGLERAGMQCVAQVEINDYANKVLSKHWPDVPRFRDVREVGSRNLPAADLICGGFPCQDISYAGRGAGLAGERSGLWYEYARIVSELRPRYVLVENVAALLTRGLSDVLGTLASLGYDAEWHCIPAAYVGAPHRRDRVFIIAYASEVRRQRNNQGGGRIGAGETIRGLLEPQGCFGRDAAPPFRRMDDGLPAKLERLGGLGNAVVPQVAELLGKAIVAHSHNS
jgi:DNA (cytosine-5)-methyltransferase 1